MHILRRIAAVACTATITLGTGAAFTPAQADGFTNNSCHGPSYNSKLRLVSANSKPVVTHVKGFSMPPTSSHKVTKRTARSEVVRSRARISGGVTATLGNKVISKAEVRLNASYARHGAHTQKTATRVTDRIANRTGRNQTYAFYKGVSKGYGKWKISSCRSKYVNGDYKGTYVYWRYGKWSSFEFADSGALRCGAGTANVSSVGKLALRRVCN